MTLVEGTLFNTLSKNGMRALCKVLSEHFINKNTCTAASRHVTFKLPASLYVSGLPAANLGSVMYEEAVLVEVVNLKFLQ